MRSALDTPWKVRNELRRLLSYPLARLVFLFYGVHWGKNWRFYGAPILQKHRRGRMILGDHVQLRSFAASNPLGPNRPVVLCVWEENALLQVGDHFGMTGGTLCAAESIIIGSRVIVGANSTIIDTDFHPVDFHQRLQNPADGRTAPIVIEDDVFIGMNSLILKGVTIGRGSVVGAGSVVTADVPPGSIVAGNPARIIGKIPG